MHNSLVSLRSFSNRKQHLRNDKYESSDQERHATEDLQAVETPIVGVVDVSSDRVTGNYKYRYDHEGETQPDGNRPGVWRDSDND
jgi:hypothetical protein